MKKFAFALAFIILFLCGCAKGSEIKPDTYGISFNLTVIKGGEKYLIFAKTDREKPIIDCTVLSPGDIKGMKFHITEKDVTVKYMGLSYKPKLKNLPIGNILSILYDCLFETKTAARENGNENYTAEGSVDGIGYTMVLAPSGLPLSISVPQENIKVTFSNLTLVK